MLQAVWFDAGRETSGRLLLVIHHLAVDGVSWRILLPDLQAAWTAAVRGAAPALPAPDHVVPALGACAGHRGAECRTADRAAVLDRDVGCAGTVAVRRRARSRPRHHRRRPRAHADAAARRHGRAADARSGGVPCRRQRRAADRAGAGGHGLVPAAWPRRRCACRADGCRGPRPRGVRRGQRRARPVAHGRLVHQPLPGAARSGRHRSRRCTGGRRCHRPSAQDHQGAVAGAARPRARLRTVALSQPADGAPACAACGAADRLQLPGAVRGARHRRLGERARSHPARWRRSGAGAGACDRGQCVDARRRRRPEPHRDLDLGAGADVRGHGARAGAGLVPGARARWRLMRSGRAPAAARRATCRWCR